MPKLRPVRNTWQAVEKKINIWLNTAFTGYRTQSAWVCTACTRIWETHCVVGFVQHVKDREGTPPGWMVGFTTNFMISALEN